MVTFRNCPAGKGATGENGVYRFGPSIASPLGRVRRTGRVVIATEASPLGSCWSAPVSASAASVPGGILNYSQWVSSFLFFTPQKLCLTLVHSIGTFQAKIRLWELLSCPKSATVMPPRTTHVKVSYSSGMDGAMGRPTRTTAANSVIMQRPH